MLTEDSLILCLWFSQGMKTVERVYNVAMKELWEGSSLPDAISGGGKWGSHHSSFESHIKRRMFKTKIKAISGQKYRKTSNILVKSLLYVRSYSTMSGYYWKSDKEEKYRQISSFCSAVCAYAELGSGNKMWSHISGPHAPALVPQVNNMQLISQSLMEPVTANRMLSFFFSSVMLFIALSWTTKQRQLL